MNRLCGSSDGQERDVFVVDRPRPEVARVEMRNKIRVRREERKRGEKRLDDATVWKSFLLILRVRSTSYKCEQTLKLIYKGQSRARSKGVRNQRSYVNGDVEGSFGTTECVVVEAGMRQKSRGSGFLSTKSEEAGLAAG